MARILGALVDLDFAPEAGEPRRADALVAAALVEAGTIVLAGVSLALVDVYLAPGASEAGRALAPERAGRVDTNAPVLAGRTDGALVVVDRAVGAAVAGRAGADCVAVGGRWVAGGILVARRMKAAVVELAEDAGLAGRTLAVEVADSVVASCARLARGLLAVVDVLAAVGPGPAVDTDALVAVDFGHAGGPVFAHIRLLPALIGERARQREQQHQERQVLVACWPVHLAAVLLASAGFHGLALSWGQEFIR